MSTGQRQDNPLCQPASCSAACNFRSVGGSWSLQVVHFSVRPLLFKHGSVPHQSMHQQQMPRFSNSRCLWMKARAMVPPLLRYLVMSMQSLALAAALTGLVARIVHQGQSRSKPFLGMGAQLGDMDADMAAEVCHMKMISESCVPSHMRLAKNPEMCCSKPCLAAPVYPKVFRRHLCRSRGLCSSSQTHSQPRMPDMASSFRAWAKAMKDRP